MSRSARAAPPIRITRGGTRIHLPPRALARMRKEFRERHFTRLGLIFDAELLAETLARIQNAAFAPLDDENERYIHCLGVADPRVNVSLSFLFNDETLYEAIRSITDCPPIRGFIGRVIRHDPGMGHYLRWHTDARAAGPDRIVALRLNLSPRRFHGGDLLVRGARETKPRAAFRCGAVGEAVIFRATKDSFHCNTEVRGVSPKIAFSGWFFGSQRGGGSIEIAGKSIFSRKNIARIRGRRAVRTDRNELPR